MLEPFPDHACEAYDDCGAPARTKYRSRRGREKWLCDRCAELFRAHGWIAVEGARAPKED